MDHIVKTIQELAKDADEIQLKQILDQLRNVMYNIETPLDTMQRLMFNVNNLYLITWKAVLGYILWSLAANILIARRTLRLPWSGSDSISSYSIL